MHVTNLLSTTGLPVPPSAHLSVRFPVGPASRLQVWATLGLGTAVPGPGLRLLLQGVCCHTRLVLRAGGPSRSSILPDGLLAEVAAPAEWCLLWELHQGVARVRIWPAGQGAGEGWLGSVYTGRTGWACRALAVRLGPGVWLRALGVSGAEAPAALSRSPALSRARRLGRMARDLARQGDTALALPLAACAYQRLQDEAGEEHPHTALALNDLGVLLRAAGELEQARGQHQRALMIRQRLLGAQHPETAISRYNLACVLAELGQIEQAIALLDEANDTLSALLGRHDPRASACRAAAERLRGSIGAGN